MHATAALPIPDQHQALARDFPEHAVTLDDGVMSYRRCGAPDAPATLVLLHGIGSGAASWLACATALAQASDVQVIAWNAPGYGKSAPLTQAVPSAADYADRLHRTLRAIACTAGPVVLVGHSLGALVAAAYVAAHRQTVARLVLLSPAHGYGTPEKRAQGDSIRQTRLSDLDTLGVAGMAARRAPRMLSAAAGAPAHAWVHWNMEQLRPEGYCQAVDLLCGDAISHYPVTGVPGAVWCGSDDVITTPEASATLAATLGLPYGVIHAAGHACYIEQPAQVAAAIDAQRRNMHQ